MSVANPNLEILPCDVYVTPLLTVLNRSLAMSVLRVGWLPVLTVDEVLFVAVAVVLVIFTEFSLQIAAFSILFGFCGIVALVSTQTRFPLFVFLTSYRSRLAEFSSLSELELSDFTNLASFSSVVFTV